MSKKEGNYRYILLMKSALLPTAAINFMSAVSPLICFSAVQRNRYVLKY